MLYGIVLAAVAAAGCTIALALTSDHLSEPGVQAALMVWVVVPYVLAGVIAWWRRPESQLGLLMIGAGFGLFLSALSWANTGIPYTIGIAFDLVPAVLFLHVFLAFPSGRLELWYERALVAAGYATAFGVHLFGMLLGGFGPDNVIALTSDSHASYELLRAELVVLAAVCLAGIGVLALGDKNPGAPSALPRAADRLVRPRPRDARRPPAGRRIRRAERASVRDHSQGDLLRDRPGAARVSCPGCCTPVSPARP